MFSRFGYRSFVVSFSGVVACLLAVSVQAQTRAPHVQFEADPAQRFGFDAVRQEAWKSEYTLWEQAPVAEYYVPVKSCGKSETDVVKAKLVYGDNLLRDSVRFWVAGTDQEVLSRYDGNQQFTLFLPPLSNNYTLSASYLGNEIGRLKVVTYAARSEKVFLIPLTDFRLVADSIETRINAWYRQANVAIDLTILPAFEADEWKNVLLYDDPSFTYERYTDQMHNLRDAYLEKHPNLDKKAYYLFVIPGFENPGLRGFMLRNRALGFVKNDKLVPFSRSLAFQLGRGMGSLRVSWAEDGPEKGTTQNLMDVPGGNHLRFSQWQGLRFHSHSYSLFDSYEDIRANNGFVAYYFWEEDNKGMIRLQDAANPMKSIRRPYKKNYLSYHLNIDNFLFKPLFTVWGYLINSLHLTGVLVLAVAIFYFGRKLGRAIKTRFRRWRLLRFSWRILQLCLFVVGGYLLFLFINLGYSWFEVHNGRLNELDNLSPERAVDVLEINDNSVHPSEPELCSEILIRKNKKWYRSERMPVLYFTVRQDQEGGWTRMRFQAASDSLNVPLLDTIRRAESHYIVLSYVDKQARYLKQRVFNHAGVEITEKLKVADPPKRILLFVNGYRPTSVGHSFEENFADIRANGLEFPNSRNSIYAFDRYEYWRPWNAIDGLFQQRINPSETYYADGHFSVSTSNHRSLINFTTLSAAYPKRCSNQKKHHCYRTRSVKSIVGKQTVSTYSLHRTRPNKRGFRKRKNSGHIAGRNVYQLLNEIPNRSANDTLFIVAHSMGYAYALGIIDELRGKINFGGCYIIAPENASAGKMRPEEWQEVWQFGSHFDRKRGDAPCLLDGVAPQVTAGGLSGENRVYIPSRLYNKKGFFDAHFIGYYTWILDIPPGQRGYVTQH